MSVSASDTAAETDGARRGACSRWFGFVILMAYLPLLWVPALLLVSNWAIMGMSHLAHYVSGFAAVCFVIALALHLGARRLEKLEHGRDHPEVSPPARGGPRAWRFCALAAGPLAILAGETALDWAAKDVHDHIEKRFPHADELYRNHDIARLVGQTVRAMLVKAAGAQDAGGVHVFSEDERRQVEAMAAVLPASWIALVSEPPGGISSGVRPLTEEGLWRFIQDPASPALDSATWSGVLQRWAQEAQITPLRGEAEEYLIRELSRTFAFAWREALKHDYEYRGKAAAAMQLDLLGQLMRRTAEGAPGGDLTMKQALAEMLGSMASLKELVSEVRAQQGAHAELAVRGFDELGAKLGAMAEDLAQTRDIVERMGLVSDEFHVRLYRDDGSSTPSLGPIGLNNTRVLTQDYVSIHMAFSQGVYLYLLALDTNGSQHLLWPEKADLPPPACDRLDYPCQPKGTRDDRLYRLTDGPGTQAFIVLVARNRLPAWTEWRLANGQPPWEAGEVDSAVRVLTDSGEASFPLERGEIGSPPNPTRQRAVDWARSARGVDLARFISFPVQQRRSVPPG